MFLTPAADRPWISGTSDNSIWDLIVGYNGLGRLDGQSGGPGGMGGPGGGGAGNMFGGSTGVGRLVGEALGGQAGWLVGFALAGAIGIAVVTRLRREDIRTGWLVATGGAFLTCAVAFSSAKGIFHPYYVSLLAPFTAALVGGTVGLLRSKAFSTHVILPAAVLAGVASELLVLRHVDGFDRLPVLLVLVGVAAAIALAVVESTQLRAAVLALALGVLLIAPASWSIQTVGHATTGTFPAGGPASASMGGGPGGGGPGGARGFRPPAGANGTRGFTPPAGGVPGRAAAGPAAGCSAATRPR